MVSRRASSASACAWRAGFGPVLAIAAAALVLVVAATPARALDIVSTQPAGWALGVSTQQATIEIVFDAPIAMPPATAFRVAGTMSGLHTGTLSRQGNVLRWQRGAKSFMVGEVVNVNLRSDVQSTGGSPLTGGRTFAFTIHSTRRPISYTSPSVYSTAAIPYFIHGGDLDGDRRPDLAVPNEGSNDVSIFRNTSGNGNFTTHADYGVGFKPSSIFGEDFDNDGDQDLATADIDSGTLTVLRNNGLGVFSFVAGYNAGTQTRQVHGGDFDGDNDIDLCATARGTHEVYLFYNNGNGTFAGMSRPMSGGPFAIRCADLNGDRRADIAVALQEADSLEVLGNTGSDFVKTGRWRMGNGPWCLNGNDFDADGDFDLVSVLSFANQIVLLRNDGTGKYPTRQTLSTGSFPLGVFAADLDGDGDIDATSSNYNAGNVGIYLNDGAGTLAAGPSLPTTQSGSYTWAHDVDGDGDLDLSIVDEEADDLYIYRNGGTASDTGEPPTTDGSRPIFALAPNPVRAGRAATLLWQRVGGALPRHADVYDVAGRRVVRLPAAGLAGESIRFDWSGLDAHGAPLAPGRYVAVIQVGDAPHPVSVVVVP